MTHINDAILSIHEEVKEEGTALERKKSQQAFDNSKEEKKCPKCKHGFLAPIGTREKRISETQSRLATIWACDECPRTEEI